MTGAAGIGRYRFPALGTTAELLTYPATALHTGVEVLRDELSAIDCACSRFRHDSEISLANLAAGRWVEISPLLMEAVTVALVAARQSDGAVDPTVGRALCLLGYDRDFALLPLEGPPLPLRLEPVAGWHKVDVDRHAMRLRVPAGVALDLGATAKALAADHAAQRIARTSDAGALVSLGGDISLAGPPPPGGWPVHVTDDHRAPVSEHGQTVTLASGGLATSSTLTRGWQRGGGRAHHIVDPLTGASAAGPWRTVSVAAATCVEANTASTATLVKGGGGLEWLSRSGLPGRLVAQDGEVTTVNNWPTAGTKAREVPARASSSGVVG